MRKWLRTGAGGSSRSAAPRDAAFLWIVELRLHREHPRMWPPLWRRSPLPLFVSLPFLAGSVLPHPCPSLGGRAGCEK